MGRSEVNKSSLVSEITRTSEKLSKGKKCRTKTNNQKQQRLQYWEEYCLNQSPDHGGSGRRRGGYYGVKVTETNEEFVWGRGGGLEDLFGDRKIWQIIRYIYTFFWQLDLSRNFEECSKQSGAHNAGLAVQTARWEKKNSVDCTMNKKTTNIYFPVLVIIIFLFFVADQESAKVNLPGKKKRELRKKRVYFYGDWLCLL